jgi:hypothetical protein
MAQDALLEEATNAEYLRLKAHTDAERRLASETYQGTRDLPWDELLTFSDDNWLIEDLIGRGTTSFLTAKPNLGKTFTYIDAMCHGALGTEWLGLATAKFRTLVYVSEGAKSFGARVLAWCRANGDLDPSAVTGAVAIKAGANLASDAFQVRLASDVAAHKPDLIVFDTWSGTSGVKDENAAADVSRALRCVREVTDAAVLFVHHPNKDSQNGTAPTMRGSGATFGAADSVIVLYEDRNFDGPQDTYLALSTEHDHGGKSRDARTLTIQGLYLESLPVGYTPSGREVSSCALLWDNTTKYSVEDRAVREHLVAGMTVAEFASAIGKSPSTAERWLKASEYAQQASPARGKNPATWSPDPVL